MKNTLLLTLFLGICLFTQGQQQTGAKYYRATITGTMGYGAFTHFYTQKSERLVLNDYGNDVFVINPCVRIRTYNKLYVAAQLRVSIIGTKHSSSYNYEYTKQSDNLQADVDCSGSSVEFSLGVLYDLINKKARLQTGVFFGPVLYELDWRETAFKKNEDNYWERQKSTLSNQTSVGFSIMPTVYYDYPLYKILYATAVLNLPVSNIGVDYATRNSENEVTYGSEKAIVFAPTVQLGLCLRFRAGGKGKWDIKY